MAHGRCREFFWKPFSKPFFPTNKKKPLELENRFKTSMSLAAPTIASKKEKSFISGNRTEWRQSPVTQLPSSAASISRLFCFFRRGGGGGTGFSFLRWSYANYAGAGITCEKHSREIFVKLRQLRWHRNDIQLVGYGNQFILKQKKRPSPSTTNHRRPTENPRHSKSSSQRLLL